MIIGLCGFIGSGKGTVGDYLVSGHGFASLSFAHSLKDAVAAIFHWPRDLLEGNTHEGRVWRETVDQWWSNKLGITVTPRWALQHIGTDVMRDHFADGIWVWSVEKRLVTSPNKNIVITDIRFPNEAAMLKSLPYTQTVWVRKSKLPDWYDDAIADVTGIKSGLMSLKWPEIHCSEWEWLGTKIDQIIFNDSTITELYESVDQLVLNTTS